MDAPSSYAESVFINCPFDADYIPILRAIVFCVYRCGFKPVTALTEDNALDNRLLKIERCVEACRYGIHDVSRTELNINGLPRFNMPFELGLFFGAKYFGNKQQTTKNALIFDRDQYRYLEFISDINGIDIKAHNNNPDLAVKRSEIGWLPHPAEKQFQAQPSCKMTTQTSSLHCLNLQKTPVWILPIYHSMTFVCWWKKAFGQYLRPEGLTPTVPGRRPRLVAAKSAVWR